jgi:hypothetical protein
MSCRSSGAEAMTARRGNSSRYHKAKGSEAHEALDKIWRARRGHSLHQPDASLVEIAKAVFGDKYAGWLAELMPPRGLSSGYELSKEKSFEKFANKSIKGSDIAEALDFLAVMTNDPAFKTAASALRGYGLVGGGLKQETSRLIKESNDTAAWLAMPHMSRWVAHSPSIHAAAERTAAQLGIAGATFAAVVRDLCDTYPIWLKAVEENAPVPSAPNGDTGRKLKVRLPFSWHGAEKQPVLEFGVKFDEDGFGIAPDNRDWRRRINKGQVALYGVVEEMDGRNLETNNQAAP